MNRPYTTNAALRHHAHGPIIPLDQSHGSGFILGLALSTPFWVLILWWVL